MRNAFKGVIFSGLIFPGLGQIVLKYYKRGAVIMLAVFVSISTLAGIAVKYALAILEKLEAEGSAISMSTVASTAAQAYTASVSLTFNLILLFIVLCWVIGIVDAYRIGREMDIEEKRTLHRM